MNPMQLNPLLSAHFATQAEMVDYEAVQIVNTFGAPQAEYAAIRKSAGLMDLPHRGLLQLTGRDRLPFLNNLLTNELVDRKAKSAMPAGRVIYAFFLNLKGRVVADVQVIEMGDRTLLEMDVRLVEPMHRLLDKYLFAEQVKMEVMIGKLHQIALQGPESLSILVSETGQPFELSAGECRALRLLGQEVIAWRDDVCGVPGVHLVVPIDAAEPVWNHLTTRYGQEIEKGKRLLRPVGWAAFNTTRIEAGRPLFGVDFELAQPSVPGKKVAGDAPEEPGVTGVLPAETGLLDRAVDFEKGCYLGQEIVARMHARGQVARKLVGLRMKSDDLPIAGAVLTDDKDNQVGVITSSTLSPILSDVAIALGMVRKPHYASGTLLNVAAEGAMRKIEVVPLPFIA